MLGIEFAQMLQRFLAPEKLQLHEFGKQASKVQLRRKVMQKVGVGLSAMCRVRWDKPDIDMLLNTCSLTCETRDLEPEDDVMNSSCDDEDEMSLQMMLLERTQ